MDATRSAEESITLSAPDFRRLTAAFSSILAEEKDRGSLLNAFVQQTLALVNGAGGVYFSDQGSGLSREFTLLSRQMQELGPSLEKNIDHCAGEAVAGQRLCYQPLDRDETVYVVCCPLSLDRGCLAVLLATDRESLSPFLITLQLLAALLDHGLGQPVPDTSSGEGTSSSAVFLEQLTRVLQQPQGRERLQQFNQVLKSLARADLAALAVVRDRQKIRLDTVSDVSSMDSRTRQFRTLEKGLVECSLRNAPLAWPVSEDCEVQPSRILEEICSQTNGASVLVLPIAAPERDPVAFLLLSWKSGVDLDAVVERFAGLSPLLAGILPCLEQPAGRLPGRGSEKKSTSGWSLQYKVTAAVLGLLIILLLVPLPYRVSADAVAKPAVTRFVVSRYDGLLKKSLVRPGDQVKAGQVLALLDGREIEVQLAALQAERDKAAKMQDQATALGNTAAAQIARLDRLRYEQQIAGLRDRLNNLTLLSPVDGIVLTGDLQRAEGSPVSRGQTLFEVAPLKNMEIEIFIDETDISRVSPHALARVRFDAFPDNLIEDQISRLEPRARIRNNHNIFTAVVQYTNQDNRLRPGMRGSAGIEADTRTTAWILFHKPWYTLLGLFDSVL